MDLRFSPEENAFREELRTFFRTAVPAEIRKKVSENRHLSKEEMVTAHKILHSKGLAVRNGPRSGAVRIGRRCSTTSTPRKASSTAFPQPLPFNVSMNGPVVIAFGTEGRRSASCRAWRPSTTGGASGFSEPGAGSDLAGLKTTAVRQGDHYIVNGQKTWTTLAQHADWIFCLCRTDPTAKKQLGISYLLIDMKTHGITVRPIQTLDGGHEVNEVFFDDVKVPVENLVGQEHRGWDCAKFLLRQ